MGVWVAREMGYGLLGNWGMGCWEIGYGLLGNGLLGNGYWVAREMGCWEQTLIS